MKKIVCLLCLSFNVFFVMAQEVVVLDPLRCDSCAENKGGRYVILDPNTNNSCLMNGEGIYVIDEYYVTKKNKEVREKKSRPKKSSTEIINNTNENTDVSLNDNVGIKNRIETGNKSKVYYSGMVDVGLGGEIFSESFSMSVSTTHGIHISDYFFVGAELGYSYWHPYYKIYDYGVHSITYLLDLRVYMARGKFRPYLDLKVGGGTGYTKREASFYDPYYYTYSVTGLLYGFELGINMFRYLSLGFSATSTLPFDDYYYVPSNLQFKIGVRF